MRWRYCLIHISSQKSTILVEAPPVPIPRVYFNRNSSGIRNDEFSVLVMEDLRKYSTVDIVVGFNDVQVIIFAFSLLKQLLNLMKNEKCSHFPQIFFSTFRNLSMQYESCWLYNLYSEKFIFLLSAYNYCDQIGSIINPGSKNLHILHRYLHLSIWFFFH